MNARVFKILVLGILFIVGIPTAYATGSSPRFPASVVSQSTALEKDMTLKDTLPEGWIDMQELDSNVQLDIRYATHNNFVNEVLYPCGRCILREQVAKALQNVHASLREQGFGVRVFDCYRPRPVQQKLWNKVPDARYVTPPTKGSMHNRGAAVDLTLTDANGNPLDMGTAYDFFGKEAYHTYRDLPEKVLQMRTLLRREMEKQGFKHIRTEWWHYSFQKKQYKLADFLWPCDGI